jgi:DNA-binding transcriptional MerR regulator
MDGDRAGGNPMATPGQRETNNGALRNDGGANELPPIPAKRYFTIGEVSELCGVKPHVLRYWEQEFTQLKPIKRNGNRRYYQHHEVLLVRRIRELLYEQRFTISGARNRLDASERGGRAHGGTANGEAQNIIVAPAPAALRSELEAIRALLKAR